MGRKKMSIEECEEIARLYSQGVGSSQIARQFNCSREHVVRTARKMGCEIKRCAIKPKSLAITEEQKEELLDRYAAGERVEDLAAMFNVTTHVIYHFASRNKQRRLKQAVKRRDYSKTSTRRKRGEKLTPIQQRKKYQKEHSSWTKQF